MIECITDVEKMDYLCSVLLFVGSVVGQRICDHPDVRKVGFTGSTPVGAGIMKRYILVFNLNEFAFFV